MSRSEARTRKELIDPKLKDAGWSDHDWQIEWEYTITDGRIHFDGKVGRRNVGAGVNWDQKRRSGGPMVHCQKP